MYYAAQAISRQGERGTEWKYKIAGVYCIAFLNFLDKTLEKKFRTDAGILDMETHKVVSGKMRWIYLQLPLFAKEEWGECETDFDRFMLIMKNMEVLKRMPEAARESVFAKLREIADISSLSKEDRVKYDYAIKKYRDTLVVMERQRKEGKEEVAREMKKNGISVEMIMKCTGLSREEVEEL